MESTAQYTCEEPKYMHYHELQAITKYFDKELGRGGFGAVYKGKCQEEEVAVKVLLERSQGNQDNEFKEELLNLVQLSHKNIIRLVGYCCETYEKYDRRIGKLEPVTRTALCFEYAPNGNLRNYTFDENHRLDWHKVYNIIKGTCEGLHYLHHHSSGSMWHLDLKPENILLDDNMVPKIADFGLSKLFANPTTKVMEIGGTPDYVPLEYKMRGQVTRKFDIFSLGVIIIEIMAGIETYRILDDFDNDEEVIKLVLEKWNGISSGYYKQVRICIEIALKCVAIKPKNRPELKYIIDMLNEVENIVPPTPLSQNSSKHEGSSTGEMISSASKELIQVDPLDLCFPYEPMKKVHSSSVLKLINITDDYVALILMLERRTAKYSAEWSREILSPRSTSKNIIRRIPEGVAAQSMQCSDKFIVRSTVVSEGLDVEDITNDMFNKEMGRIVHEVTLRVVLIDPSSSQLQSESV